MTPTWEKETLLKGSKRARVFSPSNIALAKYWGKRDLELNLPTNGSLSATLKGYGSFTTVEFHESFSEDELILNAKKEAFEKTAKIRAVLTEIRNLAGVSLYARVQSFNNFPTAAGLASSASGLSAVAYGASEALALALPRAKLSEIARKGSGSACRSLFAGFVEWKRGELADGSDSVATPIFEPSHWPFKVLIAIVNQAQKNHASTGGMEHTKKTSPYFEAWVENAQKQVKTIRDAIKAKDFDKLAEEAESNCIRMHASAMAAQPAVMYWKPATLELIEKVRELRAQGVPAFFTIDAGPNVVVFCEPSAQARCSAELSKIANVTLLSTEIGEGSRLYSEQEWGGE